MPQQFQSDAEGLRNLGEPLAFSGYWRTKEAELKYQHKKDSSNNRTASQQGCSHQQEAKAGRKSSLLFYGISLQQGLLRCHPLQGSVFSFSQSFLETPPQTSKRPASEFFLDPIELTTESIIAAFQIQAIIYSNNFACSTCFQSVSDCL